MGSRGKKSVGELSVVALSARRPEPPAELTAAEAVIWGAVVGTKPPDWFAADSFPLLVAYCRAIAVSNGLARAISTFDDEGLSDAQALAQYDKLLQMQERQCRLIASLATRMRLSQQSRFDRKKAGASAPPGPPPWEPTNRRKGRHD
jgi:hypothetical protein